MRSLSLGARQVPSEPSNCFTLWRWDLEGHTASGKQESKGGTSADRKLILAREGRRGIPRKYWPLGVEELQLPNGPALELFPDCSSALQIPGAQRVSLPGLQTRQLLLPGPPNLCSDVDAVFVLTSGERDRTGKNLPFSCRPWERRWRPASGWSTGGPCSPSMAYASFAAWCLGNRLVVWFDIPFLPKPSSERMRINPAAWMSV